MQIMIMADANNMYFTLNLKYHRKLDYEKYLKYISALGMITHARVYGVHVRGQAIDFLTRLKTLGYTPCYTNINEYYYLGLDKSN